MDYTMSMEEDNNQSLSSLPDDVVLNCLVRIPRSYDLNVSCVSKSLRSLVRSPDLYRLRSLFHKDSVYLCFRQNNISSHCHWYSLCRNDRTRTNIDYQLVPVPFPSHAFMFFSSMVAVGSEIYFIGGPLDQSKNLLILDTESGQLHVGPSMRVARYMHKAAVEVVDGKIYVIGGCDKEIRVEVFDPESQSWEFATKEKVQCISPFSVSLERKVYVVEDGKVCVYNPREGLRKEMLAKKKRKRDETMERLNGKVNCVCVVENVLYALFKRSGLMWFDTKLNEWRSLVSCYDNYSSFPNNVDAMAGYNGKLAVLWSRFDSNEKKSIGCTLIALDRVGEGIRWKIEWSGVVATFPCNYSFMHCLVVSN
ncbi:unnamed protein product [Arabis nemorensis]|uniref:F-box domain-containing protein n=1 Tax=Arabis nemorensis TaxID=586526 RepID=A0A565BNK2_9BRAS|nr:unnamed protein product [Arabis nemorensis]